MREALPSSSTPQSDLIEKVAIWLYTFDGSPAATDTAEAEDVYRNRAVTILQIVRDHDVQEANDGS